MPKNITFNQLKAIMPSRLGQPGMPSESSLPNANTALGKFCRAIKSDMDSRVGQTLRSGFTESLACYREQLAQAGNSRETVNNKASLMNSWARLVRTLDHEGASAAGTITPFQSKLSELFDTRTDMFRIAKLARVSWRTLRNWKRGAMPKSTSDGALQRLAVACGLAPDALVTLLPFAVGRKVASDIAPMDIPSRRRNTLLVRSPYLLKPHQATEEFQREWRGLLTHKVPMSKVGDEALGAKLSIREKIQAALQYKPHDCDRIWRVRPIEDYGAPGLPAWVNVIGRHVVPSAEKVFRDVTSFLGWLRLPPHHGGHGVPNEDLSLGMLVDEEKLDEYLQWHAIRVGTVNSGTMGFIASVRSHTRPETGYLWLATWIGRKLGFDEASWRERCGNVNTWLGMRLCQFASIKEPARDPALPLKPLLDMPRPLKGFSNAIHQYASEVRLFEHQRATQARDLALLALSISNPLRLTNLRLLTYKKDNTGHLRKSTTGSGWEVFVPKEEFKNIRGTAKDKDYHMPLSEIAAHYLEEYIAKWWNYLGGPGERCLLFIAKGKPDRIWAELDSQYGTVTKKILAPIGCPSIRPHATRYLVGTALIMGTQGNAELAAAALHDKKETVERHYAKLLQSYAARGVDAVIGKDLSFDEEDARLLSIPNPVDFIKPLPR